MKLYNTLTRKTDELKPLKKGQVAMYSCGPTVYDHAHIGNLRAFITADLLKRTLRSVGYEVRHVMNFTDVDDKTIKRSQQLDPDKAPELALRELTRNYEELFLEDLQALSVETDSIHFLRATESIEAMQRLIGHLYQAGIAYVADDGVYFSIEAYKKAGKTYGQLTTINSENTGVARVDNDEYDKDNVHDFALWKTQKPHEPTWQFELDGHNLTGRPGWHIECSAMSTETLGQPFDIHTGGVDLIFPHHENEIAQSTAASDVALANWFVHNEHLLVDNRKMSKSLNNFYTLKDIQDKSYDPLAFRLLVLQSHYRKPANFTWEALEAAQNRLKSWQSFADLLFQSKKLPKDEWLKLRETSPYKLVKWKESQDFILRDIKNDLNTPEAITWLDRLSDEVQLLPNNEKVINDFRKFFEFVDKIFGLNLSRRSDITSTQKQLIKDREAAREAKDWAESDELRDQLQKQGIAVRDTPHGTIWSRT